MRTKVSPVILASTAALFSISFSVSTYIQYFQKYGLSFKRELLAIFFFVLVALLVFGVLQAIIRFAFSGNDIRALKSLGVWVLIAVLLSPCFFPIPHYPASELFQASSDLTITIRLADVSSEPVQLKGVWLRFDEKDLSYKDFARSGEWTSILERLFLGGDLPAELNWRGKIGERASLTIFPMDAETLVTVLWDGEMYQTALTDKPFVINRKSVTPMWYYALIVILRIVCLGFAFFVFFALLHRMQDSRKKSFVVFALLVFLSLYTVYAQFENPEIKGRLDIQMGRHDAVISGGAPDPWQYRVFSEWLIEGLVWFGTQAGFESKYLEVFVLLRIAQNLAIFILVRRFFWKIGFSDVTSLLGIILLAASMLNSFHQSDLSFNTYFDLIFYLAASLLILNNSFAWLPLLMLFASLNRETSGLIPIMAFSTLTGFRNGKSKLLASIISLAVWAGVFLLLRMIYPGRELFIPYGYHPGWELFAYNASPGSLLMLLRFLSFTPLVGFVYYGRWAPELRRFFIALIPVWFLVHFFGGVVSEARLFLVPQALVLIPAFLTGVRARQDDIFPV